MDTQKTLNEEYVRYLTNQWQSSFDSDKWKNYLAGIDDPHIKLVTGVVLENQRIFNTEKDYDVNLCKKLYQVIVRVIPTLVIHKLISVQPMLQSETEVLSQEYTFEKDENGKLLEDVHKTIEMVNGQETKVVNEWTSYRVIMPIVRNTVKAKTRNLKIPFSDDVEELAAKIRQEIEWEVLRDLWNNVGTVTYNTTEIARNAEHIPALSAVLHRKTLQYDRYWILVSRATYEKEQKTLDHYNQWSSLYRNGLHVVDHWKEDGILMGAYGLEFWRKQYCYCPYIFLEPFVKDGVPTLLTRYSKRLHTEGAKAYGKMTFKIAESK